MAFDGILDLLLSNVVHFDLIIDASEINSVSVEAKADTSNRILALHDPQFFLGSLLPDPQRAIIADTSDQISRLFRTGNALDNPIMPPIFPNDLSSLDIPVTDRFVSGAGYQPIRVGPRERSYGVRVRF